MDWRGALFGLLAWWAAGEPALAQGARYDLKGPALEVAVVHLGQTLPISEVPNLAPGDQLTIKADLPAGEAVNYLLVCAFLRGAANPPPETWFHKSESWTPKGRSGMKVTVPAGAEQAILFLAPQTGGDYKTLVGAVRGRPGAFVRASQDLNQASLDRARLDAFLAALKDRSLADADRLRTTSPLLARSLGIKLNSDCLQKNPELQVACLMQGADSLVLADGHSTSMVEALTTGVTSDLALQLSASPQAGAGYFSPYVLAVMDIARVLTSFHTAQYQYIPALAAEEGGRVQLLLNTPPSFHAPLSVMVTALPAVTAPHPPPLGLGDGAGAFCLQRPGLVIPIEGAPLVYATHYARDLSMRLRTEAGAIVEQPLRPDAERGGFLLDTQGLDPTAFPEEVDGVVHGVWGVQPFDGPTVRLENGAKSSFRLADDERQALVVGRADVLHLEGRGRACLENVLLKPGSGPDIPLTVAADGAGRLELTAALQDAAPGPALLVVKRFGAPAPEETHVDLLAQTGRLEAFELHAGDPSGVLRGTRLDEVAGLVVKGQSYLPGPLTAAGGEDELVMTAADPKSAAAFGLETGLVAKVALKDGRTLRLKTSVGPPRPRAGLIGKSVEPAPRRGGLKIALLAPEELPQSARVTFSLKADGDTRFSQGVGVDFADGTGRVIGRLQPGTGLVVEDDVTLIATLSPETLLGPSAFGPLAVRVRDSAGASDWSPLGTLVRLPTLKSVRCASGAESCALEGSELFLLEAISSDPLFKREARVPRGFTGSSLMVPRPKGGRLYLKLHDAPGIVNEVLTQGEGSGSARGGEGGAPATLKPPASPG